MAIGVQKNATDKFEANGLAADDVTNLDRTIGTLKRCLEMAGTSTKGNRSSTNSMSEDMNDLTLEEAVPEASKWPHCQHMISQDDARCDDQAPNIRLVPYKDESQIGDIMRLITKDLSEPYSIYTYRYFLHNWPELCFLAYDTANSVYIGAVLCKLEMDNQLRSKGYVAMLAVDESCRRLGIGSRLVKRAIDAMHAKKCDEVILETEVSNKNAQKLYSNLGFIRQKRLLKYYLNGGDAFRLKLIFTSKRQQQSNRSGGASYHHSSSTANAKENQKPGCCGSDEDDDEEYEENHKNKTKKNEKN